jgi:penicillin-binding protein 1C
MLRQGELMPDQLVADLPTQFDGFVPRNFEERFDGAVPASMALARSLNVPAVRALRSHGIERTLGGLRSMGLTSIDRSADHYGLALMMGGAESTLWELTGAYASLVRILLHATGELPDEADVVHPPRPWRTDETEKQPVKPTSPPLDAASVHHTLQALQLPNRPESERGWEHFGGVHAIAWKTGTSFGLNTESTYDWKSEQWSVPINMSVSQILKFGDQLVQVGAGARYWADAPAGGPSGWGYRMTLTFLFPK